MTMRYPRTWRLILVALFSTSIAHAQQETTEITMELRDRAVGILRDTMANEQEWVKVHAAEHLLALGYPEDVRETFEQERATAESEPKYRIGIWRVLAKASLHAEERNQWIGKIRAAFLDTSGPDRLHAAETLAKLDYVIDAIDIDRFAADAQSTDAALAAFVQCALVHSGMNEYEAGLADLLETDEERPRLCAAYALRHIDAITPEVYAKLVAATDKEPANSSARPYLFGAAYIHASTDADVQRFKQEILRYAREGAKSEKYEAVSVLAIRGDQSDLTLLTNLMDDPEADVRQAASYAVLRIDRRTAHPLKALDWAIIAAYAAALLAVGLYYSRRTATTEEYLLGGRNMRPLTVGLSMFATLLSILSYLAVPGEMIKHGPMISIQYLVYPITFLVIGFVLIPVIMRAKVTSAYEILEMRLGLSVRIMGSIFFLALRLMWMALIIYVTSSKILVPLLQWDVSATPYVCIVLGIVTVLYTSMGGLRAVVMTDVVQTIILFSGAILTLAIISVQMGGVSSWWPTAWDPNWDPLAVLPDPKARVTILGAMANSFVWYICMAGSDQVAIQRYLATRDVPSARRMMLTSLCTDVTVGIFLAILGLALAAYFGANPHMLPDAYNAAKGADTLFPRFIALALPTGISGLVVAGLLAAAMSSLSSGLNSSSTVITVDFVDRFRKKTAPKEERDRLRQAKLVSVLVGIVVVSLTVLVGQVHGNLLEVVVKVANLLVAPLFVLFFMALFVPWATAPGALIAGIASLAMAVGIAYFDLFGLSFIWMVPLSLLAGIIIGPIASLLPLKPRPAP